jgi:hypothetical protein
MKKVLKTAVSVAAVAAVSANAYSLWNLEDCSGSISILDGGDQGGAFYAYDDSNDGGTSTSNLPEASTTLDVFGPHMCDVNGTIQFTTTAAYEYSFVGVGFNWTDPESVWNPTSAAGGGMTVCYTSEKPMFFELKTKPGDVYAWDAFVFTLRAESTPTHRQVPWASFAQAGWGTAEAGGVNAMLSNYSAGVQFKFEGAGSANSNVFRIGGLGWLNDADDCANQLSGSPVVPVLSAGKQGNFNLAQNGRMLSFTGVDKGTVEIINVHGVLVTKEAIGQGSSLNLAKLPTGVYMVRVKGEKLNFTQKVMLK